MKKILLGALGTLILAGWINLSNGLAQNLTISGYIRTSDGSGIQGVVMNGLPGTPTPSTNDGGYYSAEIGYNWSGTVKPTKIGYAIHPPSKNYTNVTSSITDDYRGTILPKVALRLNRESYYGNEPIEVTLTIENQGIDIITTQGFASKDFTLALRFTDPDEKLITANLPPGAVLPTPLAPPTVATPTGESIPADYVEIVPQGWVWSNTFNALDSYTLTKPGNYSVKAKFSMSDYLDRYETAPGSGVFYSPLDSSSSGDVESNVVNFTLLASFDHIAISPSSSTITAGGSQVYTATAYDSSNNSLGDVTSATTFSITPDGSCSDNSCMAKVAGVHSVTATYSGKTAIASLQVNPGVAANLAFATQPSNTVAGASITPAVTVRILDTYGNLTSSTVQVTLAIGTNPGGGTLSGTKTVAASAGVATFSNLSIDKAGIGYTLTASSTGLASATSSAFNITAGAGAKLAFGVQPTDTAIGVAISPPVTVRILDRNGNLTSSTASVTLAIGANPGKGTLGGTKTVAAVAGVATFSDLSINKVGTGYTLKASSSGLTGATSSAFNIVIYNFTGFFSPVENPPAVNTVNAGRTIPVKWRITDTKGVGISDRSSFVSLTSSKVSCTKWTSSTNTISVSGELQYFGEGYWQINWDTSKNFADTCRIMTIKLKDGTEHKARFKFVK